MKLVNDSFVKMKDVKVSKRLLSTFPQISSTFFISLMQSLVFMGLFKLCAWLETRILFVPFLPFFTKKNFFMCGNGGKELEFREDYFLKKELIFYKNTFLQSTAVLLFKPNLPLDDAFAQIFSLRSISHLEWFYF